MKSSVHTFCVALVVCTTLCFPISNLLGQNRPTEASAQATADGNTAAREMTAIEKEMMAVMSGLIASFNKADEKALLESFAPDGELIDEQGNVHSGHKEIEMLIKSFFQKFPGSKTEAELESVRAVGGVVFADGRRSIVSADGNAVSLLRFSSIWQKSDKGYKLASLRDFAEPVALSPSEALESLSWLVGDWVNEGTDARVVVNYRWSDDKNFILGEVLIPVDGKTKLSSSQRIGWDASQSSIRSWTFDVDGGFGESKWTESPDGWLIQSNAVLPDGNKGVATIRLVPSAPDRFTLIGSNRVVGGQAEPDYEIVVVKRPPIASK